MDVIGELLQLKRKINIPHFMEDRKLASTCKTFFMHQTKYFTLIRLLGTLRRCFTISQYDDNRLHIRKLTFLIPDSTTAVLSNWKNYSFKQPLESKNHFQFIEPIFIRITFLKTSWPFKGYNYSEHSRAVSFQ